MTTQTVKPAWWKAFYEETPFEFYMHRSDQAELDRTIEFLVKTLVLAPGSVVFDQCCGLGVHAIPLAKRGIEVIGVDLCSKYINTARSDADSQGLPCTFVEGDAFEFVASKPCDGAINWWTSFGYSTDDSLNRKMLERAFESLKPGGVFALEYPNMPNFFAVGNPSEVMYHAVEGGEVMVTRETVIELTQGLRLQKWTFILPDGQRMVHETSLRIYMPHTITSMLVSCGFRDIKCLGNIEGDGLSFQSRRCIFVAHKPA